MFCNHTRVYSYGFNGKENDNEVKGTGNQQDYGMRIYDPRIGKFLSVDPLFQSYAWFTPYQFAGNTPISAIDLDGLENVYVTTGENGKTTMQVEFTDKHIEAMVKGTTIPFKIIYDNNGTKKTTKQFEGPNKQNEKKVFDVAVNAARGKVCEKASTDFNTGGSGKTTTYLKSPKYEVPAPSPPPPPPGNETAPVIPNLDIKFEGNSDKFMNKADAIKETIALGTFLKVNPKSTVTLFGNTGTDSPTGTPQSLSDDAILNGKSTNLEGLMNARASAVKDLISKTYGVDPSRINTAAGTPGVGESNRNVSVQVNKVK